MTTEEKCVRSLQEIAHAAHYRGQHTLARMADDALEALNPPQEFEEVEVVRVMCLECNYVYEDGIVTTCPSCLGPSPKGIVKLTGTYKRPKPQKVKRREEIRASSWEWADMSRVAPAHPKVRLFAEWEEEE